MAISDFYYAVEVWRGTPAVNVRGQTTTGTFTLNSTIQGVVNQASSNEVQEAAQWGVRMTHKLFCPVDSDIVATDQIRANGDIYRVIGDPKNTVKRNHHYRVMLEKRGVDNNG